MYQLLDPSRFVVFITGATSGFGAAAARRYVAAGGKVIATGRRKDRLVELQNELGAENVHIAELDVQDRAAIDALIASLPAPFDAINIVLANAGLALGLQPAAETDITDWETMIATNVTGLAYTVRALLPGLICPWRRPRGDTGLGGRRLSLSRRLGLRRHQGLREAVRA
jgi:3-hydroxy acid dehydrogenase / malonic semialdehyde reductase